MSAISGNPPVLSRMGRAVFGGSAQAFGGSQDARIGPGVITKEQLNVLIIHGFHLMVGYGQGARGCAPHYFTCIEEFQIGDGQSR